MDVAAMLAESMRLHEQAKQARRLRATNARDLLVSARAKRRQAHEADPGHADPAWAAEQAKTPTGKDTHAELLAFYAQQLD